MFSEFPWSLAVFLHLHITAILSICVQRRRPRVRSDFLGSRLWCECVQRERQRIFSTAAEALCLPFKLERSAGLLWNLNTGIGKSVSLRKTKEKLILFKDHYLLACRVELSGGGEINNNSVYWDELNADNLRSTLHIWFYWISYLLDCGEEWTD